MSNETTEASPSSLTAFVAADAEHHKVLCKRLGLPIFARKDDTMVVIHCHMGIQGIRYDAIRISAEAQALIDTDPRAEAWYKEALQTRLTPGGKIGPL